MAKDLTKIVSKFYKARDTKLNYTVPNETVFRLLKNCNFNYKNKNILDIGIGNGDNLLEFKRRGGKIFGLDIRKKILKLFIKKNKQSSKNYFISDLNINFPKINKKMDLVLCKDTIYYLKPERQFALFYEVNKILKKNSFFIFQYIQTQLKFSSKNFFSYNLGNKTEFKSLKGWFKKKNPILFLKNKHIKKLISNKNFRIKKNIFDITVHAKSKNLIYTINRFILLQKT